MKKELTFASNLIQWNFFFYMVGAYFSWDLLWMSDWGGLDRSLVFICNFYALRDSTTDYIKAKKKAVK
jgi:hypothetical protein